jgi:hypothetical protein
MPNVPEHAFASTAVPVLVPAAGQAPAVHTAAVAALAAPTTGSRWHVNQVDWSYSGTPAAGATLTLGWTDPAAGAASRVYSVTNGGPGQLNFIPALSFPANSAVTFTLADGGVGVSGTVYPSGWTE